MEHNLFAEIKTHVIVFHDGSYKGLTSQESESLLIASTKANVVIVRGGSYKVSAIAKIISREDFEEEYPEKVRKEREVANPGNCYTYPDGLPDKSVKDYDSKDAYLGMVKGLKDYIASNLTTGKAEKLLEKLERVGLDLSVIGKKA